jgi:ankyrin repeat protein
LIKYNLDVKSAQKNDQFQIVDKLVHEGQYDLLEMLIKHGIDVNYSGDKGEMAYLCVRHYDLCTLRLLLENGYKIDEKHNRMNILTLACESTSPDIAFLLIKHKCELDTLKNSILPGPLAAASQRSLAMTKIMINNGATIYNEHIDAIMKLDKGRQYIKFLNTPWTQKIHNQFPIPIKKAIHTLFGLRLKNCQIKRLPKEIVLVICSFIAVIEIK